MNTPRISLTRIIALNWYGFRTIIDVNGLTLFCGETGTGKSALLDLIQFVMCPDSAKFNKAAAGETNARSLRGYCLCDTNTRERDSGQSRFIRRSGVTIAALEFEWPSPTDGSEPRRETWGIRVEFESPSAQPSYLRFFTRQRLEKEDLCDEAGQLLGENAFKMRIKLDFNGDTGFTSHKAFMEEMGVPRHLQFDTAQMRKTLPKAIAFELDSDYQKFIRNFILERNDLDIVSTKSSLNALRDTEARVTKLRQQHDILTKVCEEHDKFAHAAREAELWGHLRHALNHAESAEKLSRLEQALESLRQKHQEDLAAMETAKLEKESVQQRLNVMRSLERFESVSKLAEAHDKAKELQAEHDKLSGLAKTSRSFLAERAKAWAAWLRQAMSMNWQITADLDPVKLLQHHETTKALDAVSDTRVTFNSIWADAESRIMPVTKEIGELERQCSGLDRQLQQLDRKSTAATPLLDALRSAGTQAVTLGRVIEVSEQGETWWGMIEALLGDERNAVLLSHEGDYLKALDLWRQTPDAEPLINPGELARINDAPPQSLAAMIETKDGQAQRFIIRRLGRFTAVETTSELEEHPNGAVTPDGLVSDPPVRKRLTPMREFTLGEKGIQRLRGLKEAELAAATQRLAELSRRRDDLYAWLRLGKEHRLDQNDSPSGYADLFRMPSLERELGQARETLKILSDPELEQRLRLLRGLESDLSRVEQQIGSLKTPITDYEARRAKFTDDRDAANEEHYSLRIALHESRAKLPLSIRDSDLDERLQQAIATPGSWMQRQRQADVARDSRRGEADRHRIRRNEERVKLHQPPHEAEYSDLDPQDEANERYAERRDELSLHQLPHYDKLAAEHRAEWEKRLQDDVLDKLRERLEESTRTVNDFRRTLGHDIGNYRYVLTQHRDHAHRAIWKLLSETEGDDALKPGDDLLDYKLRNEIEEAKRELREAIDNPENLKAAALLDYRNYHRYNLEMIPSGHGEESEGSISLQDRGSALSGGEGQAPFFVAMLAAFHRVYDLGLKGNQASLGLVVMDEAFSKLSAGHIDDCLTLAQNFGLQLILAFPMDRLGSMINHADSIIQCRLEKRHDTRGAPVEVINDVIYWERQRMIDEVMS